MTNKCLRCDKIIEKPRHNKKYCSDKCRELEGGRRWREKNPEYGRNYMRKNSHKKKGYCKRWRSNRRNKFIKMYGGKCNCCGENNKYVLTLDHVKNDGSKVRKGRSNDAEYTKAINEYRPNLYQILCMNCNCLKEWYKKMPYNNEYIIGQMGFGS